MATITVTTTDGTDETLSGEFTDPHGFDAALRVTEVSSDTLADLVRGTVYINGGDVYKQNWDDDGPYAGEKVGEDARFN